jgi:hypothetical protein
LRFLQGELMWADEKTKAAIDSGMQVNLSAASINIHQHYAIDAALTSQSLTYQLHRIDHFIAAL